MVIDYSSDKQDRLYRVIVWLGQEIEQCSHDKNNITKGPVYC